MVEIIRRFVTGEDIQEARVNQLLAVAKKEHVQGGGADELIRFFETLQKENCDRQRKH